LDLEYLEGLVLHHFLLGLVVRLSLEDLLLLAGPLNELNPVALVILEDLLLLVRHHFLLNLEDQLRPEDLLMN